MNYREWASLRAEDIRTNKTGGVKRAVNDVYRRALRSAWVRVGPEYGTSIYDRDWDVLLVLDACRYDLMCEFEDKFAFLSSITPVESVGTGTRNWMQATFNDQSQEYEDEISETLYINGNPNSEDLLDPADFYELDEVWRYGYREELYVTPPRVITDRLVETFRTGDPPDRVIAHYMQPHEPFLQHQELNQYTADKFENSIWYAVLRGRVDRKTVWNAYRDNLRYVLEELELLLENLDADSVAITADHGEAAGEWGLYAHGGPPIEPLVTVPWVNVGETSDEHTHDPETHRHTDVEESTESQLRDLGYMQ